MGFLRSHAPNAVQTLTHKDMRLGDLKKGLAKLPPDMNDMEVYVAVCRRGKKQVEPLCASGYLPLPGKESIILVGLTEIQRLVESGELERPDGYIDPEDSNPKLFDDDDERP